MIDYNPKLNSFSRRYVKMFLKSNNFLKVCRSGLIQSPFGRLSTAPRHRLWSSKKGLTAWHEFTMFKSCEKPPCLPTVFGDYCYYPFQMWFWEWFMIGTTFKLPHLATFGSQLLRESLEPHEKCWSSGRRSTVRPKVSVWRTNIF